jgi:hypothetical protein
MLPSMIDQEFGNQNADALWDRYQTLLQVTESIVSHRDLSELFHDLAKPLLPS